MQVLPNLWFVMEILLVGGCLSAQYLVSWIIERLYGVEKRKEVLKEIAPTGQSDIYERLIRSSIQEGIQSQIVLMTLGDDRSIAATYVNGHLVYSS
jgi:hypothetical protein